MSAPGPTMKTIQKRFYTALPRAVSSSSTSTSSISRVRSNSAPSSRLLYTANPSTGPLAFFDSPPPPPPSSRPGNPHVLSTSRLPVKVEGEGSSQHSTGPHSQSSPHGQGQTSGQPPFSLALTSPQANSSSPPHIPASHQSAGFFPYSSFAPIPFYNVTLSDHAESHPCIKRQRMRYHLDVGAYGIPKHAKGHIKSGKGNTSVDSGRPFQTTPTEDLSLAVQVGEDAYFVHENAMGVADGVGGWSRTKDTVASRHASQGPSSSALFARRLMHHCSAEALEAEACNARRRDTSPARGISPRRTGSTALNDSWPWTADVDQLHEELEDSLEDLEDGLDVLMILERAYDKTIKAHVTTAETCAPLSVTTAAHPPSLVSIPEDEPFVAVPNAAEAPPQPTPLPPETPVAPQPMTVPLKTGSSTALVAVLQHSPSRIPRASTPPLPMLFNFPATSKPTYDAVLKIAHLGDCMGMLVRDEYIAWRSAEMWWAFNMPVQLGPSSSARPRDAQILELPVQADDILILASDGLSDNLWDAEVLDEVVRFKRSFLKDKERGKGQGLLGRRTLAGMLSEALCSRARRVSERKGKNYPDDDGDVEDEVPFARRAREQGKTFRGGKIDDISVLVAVISPAPEMAGSSL
ncbi:hypothetical protein PAXRUDRAFT_134278 [Paxillus rubicundulus Ve08.2h10]|uniref:Protein phosphatase n=1 Tax=Paxillus rubicundulus Ve08.2h10 TaxID=930991 RepID=A0A0D0E8D4_9AGAM|nr:hypothetical protein PAXRUDRAFT_134278 [Paxillus rubicundulus Ve08.2h10]